MLQTGCIWRPGEQKYLDLCKTDYIPNLGKEEQSSEMKYTWGMCWDDVMQGGMLLYAINTGESQWKDQFTKHLEYWTTGYGGKQITYTPDGLPWAVPVGFAPPRHHHRFPGICGSGSAVSG